MNDANGSQYCADLLRASDEDYWLASRYAESQDARILAALYSFREELRRIPGLVSEPQLGEIRLQWWRDAIKGASTKTAPPSHPVLEEFVSLEMLTPSVEQKLFEIIDANARPLYGEPFNDMQELVSWLEKADGNITSLAVSMLGGESNFAEAAGKASVAFSLSREGKFLAPQLQTRVLNQADTLWREHKNILAGAPQRLMPAIAQFSLTPLYLKHSRLFFAARKRMKLFWTVATGAL